MKKIKRKIEIPRYSLRRTELVTSSFQEAIEWIAGLTKGEDYEVLFNTNNTGTHHGQRLFKSEEYNFEVIQEVEGKMKEYGFSSYGVVSLFQENGFVGVYINSEEDALRKRPNNWVNHGRDGLIYVIFAEEKVIEEIRDLLGTYINHGFWEYSIYDEKEEEIVDSFCGKDYKAFEKWKKEAIEKYGFSKSDFDNV
ncbi:MAG: hypothetical protein EOM19_02195 [Candidatus Moranbacteria bacterium]|nr:hypothetical protein [Candidatus Moranbacteria bacterium]